MKNYDAIVIGGGVIGTSVAYYLSKTGMKIALLERGDLASGTSSRCDGNVLISDKQPGLDTKMTYTTQLLLKELTKEIPAEKFDYYQRGSLYVVESEEEFQIASEFVKKQSEDGYPFRMMDKKEIHEDLPYLAEDIVGGVEIGCDGSLNPMTFSYQLTLQSIKLGLEVYNNSPVVDIELNSNEEIEAVVTKTERFLTRKLINCAGVWAPFIGQMVNIDIPIIPRQGQLLVAEKTFPVANRKIMEFGYMMAKFGGENYKRNISPELEELGIAFVFEPTLSDNFLIGSSRAFVGFDTQVTIEVMKGLAKRAIRFFPILKDIHVVRAYAGLRPYVKDHLPIISKVEEVPGFYIAAGHEGDGICLSLLTGKLISQMLNKEETIVPTEDLSINRFKKR